MTFKKFGALLLAGAMMTGTLGVMSPTQAKAATSENTYTMTVPSNVNIQNSGWNPLGDIQISGQVDSLKKVTVTATTTNGFKLMDADKTHSVSYTMKTEENGSEQTSFEFDAASINEESASQAIGVYVEDFAGQPAGTYTDTIKFTGTMSEAMAWSEDDELIVGMATDGREYLLRFQLTELKSGVIGYYKYSTSEEKTYNENATLQISGNVFTFICDDVEFKLDFSNKRYDFIKNNSAYKFDCIEHNRDGWLNNLPM